MTSEEVRHRMYMLFQCRNGWHCQSLEQDLKTPLPRKLHFKSSEKVIELVARGGGLGNLESKQMLDQANEMGRGGVSRVSLQSSMQNCCTTDDDVGGKFRDHARFSTHGIAKSGNVFSLA